VNGPAHDGDDATGGAKPPRVPHPREAADETITPWTPPPPAPQTGPPAPAQAGPRGPRAYAAYDHRMLRSLLGAWALSACSAEEAAAVDAHLGACGPCAEEAARLRAAVALLHPQEPLDLDPLLRARVLENCLGRRPARIPVPDWAAPYDAETARLDTFLGDLGEPEWDMPIRLVWAGGERRLPLCGVLAHLGSVDGIVATALGLDDPLGPEAPRSRNERTLLAGERCRHQPHSLVRERWRTQTRDIVRTLSFAGCGTGGLPVDFTDAVLPVRDAMLDRAFECWIHAEDIATALDYPYDPPAAEHVHRMIDLAARMLPLALAARRQAGLSVSVGRLVAAGRPGRTLHLEVEGHGGGHWYISLDSPGAVADKDHAVAHIALDSTDFCHLAAGHLSPETAAVGQDGDRAAIRDVLLATAALSRL
jgi:anti-sigma factor RsiW